MSSHFCFLYISHCSFVRVCSVDDEEHQYRLHVSGFSGSVQDSFSWYHDKLGFSTPDSGNICAEISHGGWWYNQCFYANLNGVYYRVRVHILFITSYYSRHECLLLLYPQGGHYTPKGRGPLGPDGIVWYSWRDSDYYSLRKVSMMIRPRTFRTRLSPWGTVTMTTVWTQELYQDNIDDLSILLEHHSDSDVQWPFCFWEEENVNNSIFFVASTPTAQQNYWEWHLFCYSWTAHMQMWLINSIIYFLQHIFGNTNLQSSNWDMDIFHSIVRS